MDNWQSETCRAKQGKIKIICKNLCILLVYLHIAKGEYGDEGTRVLLKATLRIKYVIIRTRPRLKIGLKGYLSFGAADSSDSMLLTEQFLYLQKIQ